jgi:hypothetical protein
MRFTGERMVAPKTRGRANRPSPLKNACDKEGPGRFLQMPEYKSIRESGKDAQGFSYEFNIHFNFNDLGQRRQKCQKLSLFGMAETRVALSC